MSRQLSELLGAIEPMFSLSLRQLEQASGRPSVDVRLSAEMHAKIVVKMRSLGLDPKDTTGKEMYYALMDLVHKHDDFLAKRLGGKDPGDVDEMLPLIRLVAERLNIPKTAWVLKHSVAKRLLKATPPKRVMKQLGYRSIDSMLKREPLPEIYGALRFAESPLWLNNFIKKYKQLSPSDFESRRIEFIQLDSKKWNGMAEAFVRARRHNITHLKELGVVLILPLPVKRMPGITITVLPLLIHYVSEIRLYSAFFKMHQVRANFGDMLITTLTTDPSKHAVMAGQHVHWRIIQRYFGKMNGSHPELFEPHVQPEDLHWRKAEEILYRLEPALHFWHDMDYVGMMDGRKPVSLGLMDAAVSYINKLPYENRSTYHFRESLWNEIFIRYMGQKALEAEILEQLDNDMIAPELLAMNTKGNN